MHRRSKPAAGSAAELRSRLAQETARVIAEHGMDDRRLALRKAMRRLGVSDQAALPGADEIELALAERQRLFGGGEQVDMLQRLRQTAIEAMDFFAAFDPRLVGPVLDGSAGAHSAVQLHLFSDDPDAVTRYLQEQNIPHQTATRHLRVQPGRAEPFPTHAFLADGVEVDLTVLPRDGLRQAPLEPGSDRPMTRASSTMLRGLMS
jgi:hypothetical protein